MGSHDRHNAPPLKDLSPGLQDKGAQWTHDECPVSETERTPQRISPARRFVFSFLVCSLVLFGLASVHSPRLWQRISCHDGRMSNQKVDVEMETETQPSAVASSPDQASPEHLIELHTYFPGLDAAHIDRTQATTLQRMAKRDTNSSSVPARSSEPSSTPEPSSSEPVTSSESSTSEPSPSPAPSTKSSTSITPSTTSSTTPPPVTSSKPTPPTSSDAPAPTSDEDDKAVSPSGVETISSGPPSTTRRSQTQTSSSKYEDDETTIYTTRQQSPTSEPPVPPKVIIETSTRTSNGQVVIVESTITVQPSTTGPKPVTESTKPPPTLQNAATRQDTHGMVLSVLAVMAVMGVLLR